MYTNILLYYILVYYILVYYILVYYILLYYILLYSTTIDNDVNTYTMHLTEVNFFFAIVLIT